MDSKFSLVPTTTVSEKKSSHMNKQHEHTSHATHHYSNNQSRNVAHNSQPYQTGYHGHRGSRNKTYKNVMYVPKNQAGTESTSEPLQDPQVDPHMQDLSMQYNEQYMQQLQSPQFEINLKYYCYMYDFPRAKNYNTWESICETFPHLKSVNSKTFDIDSIKDCRAFIIRSNNEDDVHKAIKYGIWTSTPRNNDMLNKVFIECNTKNIPIYLFYSVVKSGQFVGVAQMTSELRETSSSLWWETDKWLNQFEVQWLFIKDVSYKSFSHITIDNAPISRAKDCTSALAETAIEMLKVYKTRPNHPNIFSAFEYMDYREDCLRYYKNSMSQMQSYYDSQPDYGQYGANAGFEGANSLYYSNQYFKYNSFPSTYQGNQGNDMDLKNDECNKLLREFETGINFYDSEVRKWVRSVENQQKESDIKRIQKEISEGMDELEHKSKMLSQQTTELETRPVKQNSLEGAEKRKSRLASLQTKLANLKKVFSETNKKVISNGDSNSHH